MDQLRRPRARRARACPTRRYRYGVYGHTINARVRYEDRADAVVDFDAKRKPLDDAEAGQKINYFLHTYPRI